MKKASITALIADESGATLIEYGLMAAFVAVSAVVGLLASGETLAAIFDAVAGNMQTAADSVD